VLRLTEPRSKGEQPGSNCFPPELPPYFPSNLREQKKLVAVVLVGILLAGGVILYTSQPAEPVVEGRPLTDWLLAISDPTNSTVSPGFWIEPAHMRHAKEVVRGLGTNTIPTLLRLQRARNSRVRLFLHEWTPKRGPFSVPLIPEERWWQAAQWGWFSLGTNGAPAIPTLQADWRSSDAHRSNHAYMALYYVNGNTWKHVKERNAENANRK
jgi:hypothetical protein